MKEEYIITMLDSKEKCAHRFLIIATSEGNALTILENFINAGHADDLTPDNMYDFKVSIHKQDEEELEFRKTWPVIQMF
jgi:hypothetical protein